MTTKVAKRKRKSNADMAHPMNGRGKPTRRGVFGKDPPKGTGRVIDVAPSRPH